MRGYCELNYTGQTLIGFIVGFLGFEDLPYPLSRRYDVIYIKTGIQFGMKDARG